MLHVVSAIIMGDGGISGSPGHGAKLLYCFENHVLDTGRRELRRGEELLAVEPQVFDLLVFLLRNRDRMVSKEDLITSVWDGRIVSDSTIASRISSSTISTRMVAPRSGYAGYLRNP